MVGKQIALARQATFKPGQLIDYNRHRRALEDGGNDTVPLDLLSFIVGSGCAKPVLLRCS